MWKAGRFTAIVSVLLILGLITGVTAWTEGAVLEIEIDVAPNVLNIASSGTVVTVHTDIGYSVVAASEVCLNGISIDHWKADNQGNFVAKFNMEDIESLPLEIDEYNTLTLTGFTVNGDEIIGSQKILVKNVIPRR